MGRDILDRLEAAGVDYHITGSEALSERQVRDAASISRIHPGLDWKYIDRYADVLDARDLVDQIHAD